MQMARERSIGEHRLHEHPVPGRKNKFVITENEAWFLPFEDNVRAPTLHEMITTLVDLEDEAVERKFEDGRILVGYVAEKTREVTVHNWPIDPDSDDEVVKKRMRDIFPHAKYFLGTDDERYPLRW